MTRSEVRRFIESAFEQLETRLPFGSGRITEFNSERGNEYPMGWLESLSVSSVPSAISATIDTWTILIHIAKKDAIDSAPVQYERIIDDCDYIAQELIRLYNAVVSGHKLITMTGVGRQPFIKLHADCLTGVILSFSLVAPDKTSFC